MDQLSDDAFGAIVHFVPRQHLFLLQCTSRRMQERMSESWLWRQVLQTQFDESVDGAISRDEMIRKYRLLENVHNVDSLHWRRSPHPPFPEREMHTATYMPLFGTTVVFAGWTRFQGPVTGCYALTMPSDISKFERDSQCSRVMFSNNPPYRGVYGHTAVLIAPNKICSFGGMTMGGYHGETDTVLVLDFATFQECAVSEPTCKGSGKARGFHSCTLVGSRMFIFGGNADSEPLGDLETLDVETWEWSAPATTGSPPLARNSHSSTLIGTKLFIVGGGRGMGMLPMDGGDMNDIHILDVNTLVWSEIITTGIPTSRANIGRNHTALPICKSKILFMFGSNPPQKGATILDITTMTFSQPNHIGAEVLPRQAHSMTLIRNHLLVLGGMNSGPKALMHVATLSSSEDPINVPLFSFSDTQNVEADESDDNMDEDAVYVPDAEDDDFYDEDDDEDDENDENDDENDEENGENVFRAHRNMIFIDPRRGLPAWLLPLLRRGGSS